MSTPNISENLPSDPDNKGSVLGWGVLKDRPNPWQLAGVYSSKAVAEAEAVRLNDGHLVEYGSHRLGTDDFVSGLTPPE